MAVSASPTADRVIVTAVDEAGKALTVRTTSGEVPLPRQYLDTTGRPSLQHGYALTGHIAQGMTIDRAYVLAAEEASRKWLYTALSRPRMGALTPTTGGTVVGPGRAAGKEGPAWGCVSGPLALPEVEARLSP